MAYYLRNRYNIIFVLLLLFLGCQPQARIDIGVCNNGRTSFVDSQVGQYTGECEFDYIQGYGAMNYNNSRVYTGKWHRNQPNGYGILDEQYTGTKFIGEWVGGDKNGLGIFIFKNDSIYKGEVLKNNRTGNGLFEDKLEKYIGTFKNGLYHGRGILITSGDQVYIGDFYAGEKHGQGTLTTPEGKLLYQGRFINGKPAEEPSITKNPEKRK